MSKKREWVPKYSNNGFPLCPSLRADPKFKGTQSGEQTMNEWVLEFVPVRDGRTGELNKERQSLFILSERCRGERNS